jgi:hypothetical protein
MVVAFAAYLVGKARGRLPPIPPRRGGRQFSAQVHGIFHKNTDGSSRQDIIAACHLHEEVFLYPEPDNPVDHDAIRICRHNGEQLGYLKAGTGLADDLRAGKRFKASIEELYDIRDKPGTRGVAVRIEQI